MAKGRKRKPTAEHIANGNPGKRRLPDNEPKPQVKIPPCPKHLCPIGKAEWRRISKDLHRAGLLTVIDRAALAGYCAAFARWADAEEKLLGVPKVVKSPHGYPMPHPYVGVANRALELMLKFLVEFGMTPSSRSRCKSELKIGDADSKKAKLIAMMGGRRA